ncbi:MAG: thioether cross-link-forming SCIFF peptide maturase [Dethiobacter sp.]|jgi:uncharacterized protein|nr:thioether cross-link-forming SCIFF peptide maturase [Dethiobacter sp.]
MIHTFTLHGLNMVLDVESGALHILDEPSLAAVEMLQRGADKKSAADLLAQKYGACTSSEVLSEIEELKEKSLLFCERRTISRDEDGAVKALCLHLAHDCNLRCRYCFAGSGNYGGERRLMSAETARQAVDFLLSASLGRRHCEIDFFGGEPLLNFDVLKQTVAYGQRQAAEHKKIIKFTLTTNAVALTSDRQNYLNSNEISVVLSMDGRREVHDRMRRFPGGGGSFDSVLANCRSMVRARNGDNYYLRGTYTRHNLDFCNDILAMVSFGFKRVSLEPAVLSPDRDDALRQEDLPRLREEYESLAALLWEQESSGEEICFFHFELDLNRGPCAKKRTSGCGAGAAYLAVAPDGSIYPCHQFVGDESFCAGQVAKGINSAVLAPFLAVGMEQKEACQKCFARYFCGGGCHAAAWQMNGDLLQPYGLGCELHRIRVECGLYLQAKRMQSAMSR